MPPNLACSKNYFGTGGSRILQHCGFYISVYTASYTSRRQSSSAQLWDMHISPTSYCTKWGVYISVQMYQMSNSELLMCKVISVMLYVGWADLPWGTYSELYQSECKTFHPRYTAVLREHEWRVSGFVCDGTWRIEVGRRPLCGATRALH